MASFYDDPSPSGPPQRPPPVPPTQETDQSKDSFGAPLQTVKKKKALTAGAACKSCCMSKRLKFCVITSYFIIGPVLVGVVGVLNPLLLFVLGGSQPYKFPAILFAVYCGLGGIALFLVQLKIKFISSALLFLMSPTHRALFVIFLGSLTIAAYEDLQNHYNMIGYALGISVIIIGIIFIVISCIDKSWKKEQVNKMRQEGAAQGWQAPRTDNLDKEAQFSSNGYSATLSSSLQQPPPLQSQSFWGSQDSNRQAVSSMAQQPETQKLFMAAGSTAGNAMLQGASQEDIFYATATNPQVQNAAFETAKKAVTNPDVRAAALKGAENALSRAYDNIFDGE